MNLLALIPFLVASRLACGFKVGWRTLAANERYSNLGESQTEVFQKNLLKGMSNLAVHYTDVVLIFGKVNSGKSSLACFLSGQNLTVVDTTLTVKMIDNHNRIGEIHPWTLFPELFLNERAKMAFYDLPGHTIDNDAGFDSLSKFFTYRLLRYLKCIRILAVFNYRNFKDERGVVQEMFDIVRYRLGEIGFDKYYISIGLAVSFLPLSLDGKKILSDQVYRQALRGLLQRTHDSIDRVYGQFEKVVREKIKLLLRHFIRHYNETVLFRIPYKKGNVHEMTTHLNAHLVAERLLYLKQLHISIQNFSLFRNIIQGADIKIYNDNAKAVINAGVSKLSRIVKEYFRGIVKNSVNHNETIELLRKWIDKYKAIIDDIKFSCSRARDCCIEKIFQKVREMKIKHPRNLEFKTMTNYKYLEFVETLRLKKYEPVKTKDWVDKFSDILSYLKFSNNYLAELIKYQNRTSSTNYKKNYKVRTDQMSKRSCCGNYVLKKSIRHGKLGLLKSVHVNSLPDEELENSAHQIDDSHILQAEDAKQFAKKIQMEHECAKGWKAQILRIKGLYLNFDYISEKILKKLETLCNNSIFRIEFYALQHIMINRDFTDLFDKTFSHLPLEVAIISPNWIVKNRVKISLNGIDGKMSMSRRVNRTGNPGYPGKPAAAFLGIGLTFLDSDQLTVSSVGGNGGQGQNGEVGPEGDSAGNYFDLWKKHYCTDFRSKFCLKSPLKTWLGERYYASKVVGFYALKGIAGKPGRNGGDGGRGGHAGYGNEIIIINLENEKLSIKTIDGFGKNGTNGTGAEGGLGGRHECNFVNWRMYIFWVKVDVRMQHFCSTMIKIQNLNYYKDKRAKKGHRGVDGGGTLHIQNADKSIPYLFPHSTVNEFKNFLIKNFGYKTKRNEFIKYYYDLENNEQVENLYTLQGYNVNFIILENNSFKFENDSEYINFYDSLNHRINKFNVNKVDMYEGKTITRIHLKYEFQPLTSEEEAIAITNNKKAMNILNATLIRKIKYLRYTRGRETVIKYPIQRLLKLNETIELHKNLSYVVKERETVIEKLDTVVASLDAMNRIINEDFKPKFISLMERLNAGMLNLVKEVDALIEKIADTIRIQRIFAIVKLVVSVVASIISCIPGIGTGVSMGINAAAGIINGVLGFIRPKVDIPAGVAVSLAQKEEPPPPSKENLTIAALKLREANQQCKETIMMIQLGFKLNEIERDISKTKELFELERMPELIKNDLQSLLKAKKVDFLTAQEVYMVLKRLNLVDGIRFETFMKYVPAGNKSYICRCKRFTSTDIKEFTSSFNKNKLGIVLTNHMHLRNTFIKRSINYVIKEITGVYKTLRPLVNLVSPYFKSILGLIGAAVTLESDSKQLQEEEDKLVNMLEFKRKITDNTIPAIEGLAYKVELADFTEMTDAQFYKLIESIQKLSDTIEEMVTGFKVGQDIKTLTAQVADLLMKFQEQFVNIQCTKSEIRDLESQRAKLASLEGIKNNDHLGNSVTDVKLASTMNDIIIDWEEAVQTAGVLFFPRKNPYKVDSNVSRIRKVPSPEFNDYAKKIQNAVAELFDLFRNSKRPSNYIKFENDFKNITYQPFFSWYRHSYAEKLKKLFSGETVLFPAYANTTDYNYHAVKFGEIGIGFTIKNNHTRNEKQGMQIYLRKINNCVLNLTKFGISEYKCAKSKLRVETQIYRFSHSLGVSVKNNITYYSYENENYMDLKKLPLMLSPYGSWNITIQCKTKEEKKALPKLIDLVDLHLTGKGTYTLIEECP